MKRQIPAAFVAAPALVILAAIGFLFLVKPKMDEKASLEVRIADFQAQVDLAVVARRPNEAAGETVKVADVFLLTKALPDTADMSAVILELKSVADAAGVDFLSIAPQAAAAREDGLLAVPISLTFVGNYYDLTDFLFRLRNLVMVRDGSLDALGRVFVLESLSLAEGPDGFPDVEAALGVSAAVYTPAPPAAQPGLLPSEEAPAGPAPDPATLESG